MQCSFVLLALVAALCMISQAAAFMSSPMALGGQCALQRLSAAAPASRAQSGTNLKMVDISIAVNDGEPIESALRRFKQAVSKSGHLMELRRRKRFETNKEKEIRRGKEAARNRRMAKIKDRAPPQI